MIMQIHKLSCLFECHCVFTCCLCVDLIVDDYVSDNKAHVVDKSISTEEHSCNSFTTASPSELLDKGTKLTPPTAHVWKSPLLRRQSSVQASVFKFRCSCAQHLIHVMVSATSFIIGELIWCSS